MNHENLGVFVINDIQQVHEIGQNFKLLDNGLLEIQKGELRGQKYHKDFVYHSADDANAEISDRHTRLNAALAQGDWIGMLSINKEPERKSQGASPQEIKDFEQQDRKHYKAWKANLTGKWEQANKEKPDLIKLAKTLRNASIIQEAIRDPLAADFTEIMNREALLKERKLTSPGLER